MPNKNEYRDSTELQVGKSSNAYGEVLYHDRGVAMKRKVVIKRTLYADETIGTDGLRFDQDITIGSAKRA